MRLPKAEQDKIFQSSLPLLGETAASCNHSTRVPSFQSTLPLLGETDSNKLSYRKRKISIHSPSAGRDLLCGPLATFCSLFQSTLPLQGETDPISKAGYCKYDFNPLSLCRERPTGMLRMVYQ